MSRDHSEHSVTWGRHRIQFRLRRSTRRTLGITVRPDLDVVVTAPESAPVERILGKVGKRARWIRDQQNYFREFLPKMPPRRYVSCETHRYMGRQYRLKVVLGNVPEVKLRGRYLWIFLKRKETEQVRKLVEGWFVERAKERLGRSFARGVERMGTRLREAPRLHIRKMAKRWGSWTRRGGVWLNPELVKVPGACIDYVIAHELCHAVHGNHKREFYELLGRVMPDWENRKAQLERIGSS